MTVAGKSRDMFPPGREVREDGILVRYVRGPAFCGGEWWDPDVDKKMWRHRGNGTLIGALRESLRGGRGERWYKVEGSQIEGVDPDVLPHSRYADALLETATFATMRPGGRDMRVEAVTEDVPQDEHGSFTVWLREIGPRVKAGKSATEIAGELGAEPGYIEDMIAEYGTPYAVRDGVQLFADIKERIAAHYFMQETWHYAIAALFVLQAYVAEVLPVVFYLFIGGKYGSGKTNFLSLIAKLTDALMFENVSIAALARTMTFGKAVCVDEIDVTRGKEYDEARDSMFRQGYKADGAKYVRWNPAKNAKEEMDTYGPKCATYRRGVDPAFQSRGFMIPAVKKKGEDGFELVLANFWPEIGDLPDRLAKWGRDVREAFDRDKLKAIAYSDPFKRKVREAVGELGANRDSELAALACLVAEAAGIDIVDELRSANLIRTMATAAAEGEDLEELADIVLAIALRENERIIKGDPEVVQVRQRVFKDELNRRRKDRGEKAVTDRGFAMLRRELGVDEGMLSKPCNALTWNLSGSWLRALANKPHLANTDPYGGEVSHDSHVSPGGTPPVYPSQVEALRAIRAHVGLDAFRIEDLPNRERDAFDRYKERLLKDGEVYRPSADTYRFAGASP